MKASKKIDRTQLSNPNSLLFQVFVALLVVTYISYVSKSQFLAGLVFDSIVTYPATLFLLF
jgi:hypothetical protein